MTDPTDKNRRPARRFSTLRPVVMRRAAAPEATPKASVPEAAPDSQADEARIAKVMARAGLCSRRDAESWILAGRVAVNGTIIDSPALNIGPHDKITVDGSPVEKAERTRLFMFHKSRGLVTTAKDPEGRPTIYDALSEDLPRLVTIGRLDINTEGLLLLTNDGGLSRMLELPSTGWVRRYRVRANGSIDQAQLDQLMHGITVDGVDYAGIEAKLDRQQGANVWLTMALREGKNREIKRVLEHLGLAVSRLIRLSFGPFQLGDLPEGAVEEVKTRVLRDQLGAALAREAGVDFDGPEAVAPATATIVTREVRQAKAAERRGKREKHEAAPAERVRPARDPAEPRRHVSFLRTQRADQEVDGPRRRTERGATADRKGRAVAVERITTAGGKRAGAPQGRNARRFEQDRRPEGSAPGRERPDFAARPAGRRFRDQVPSDAGAQREEGRRPRTIRQADAERRPARADKAPARPARSGFRDESAPRDFERGRGENAGPRRPRPDERPEGRAPRARDENAARPPRSADRPDFKGKSDFRGKTEFKPRGRPERGADRPAGATRFGGKDGGFGGRSRPSGGGDRPQGGPKGGSRPGGGGGSRSGPGGGGRPKSGGGGGRGRPSS